MRQELEEIHQPHDTLFKASFGHKQVMIDFLNSRLPKETLQRIELNSLRLTNKSFVSKTGRDISTSSPSTSLNKKSMYRSDS